MSSCFSQLLEAVCLPRLAVPSSNFTRSQWHWVQSCSCCCLSGSLFHSLTSLWPQPGKVFHFWKLMWLDRSSPGDHIVLNNLLGLFPCFLPSRQFWEVLVRYFVNVSQFGFVWFCFIFSWLDRDCGFGEEYHRSEVPFFSHPIENTWYQPALSLATLNLIA